MSQEHTIIENRYQIIEFIGMGGMGSVYRAHDRLMDSTVAIKKVTVPSEQLITNSVSDPTKQSHLALANEFRALASLRHPHIISVLDYGFDSDRSPFFTMELLEDAHPITEIASTVSTDVKLKLIIQMLQALSYLHRRGILHRDLKPDNILVTKDEDDLHHIKVVDFGLAVAHNYDSQSESIIGTLAYVAPEVLRSESASKASDLYALGMIMYEILADQYPFNISALTELIESILYFRPRMTVPGIDRSMGSILKKLLQKSPEQRYQTAEEVIRAIADTTEVTLTVESMAVRESFLQSSQFVGREADFEQLQEALLDAKQKQGSLLMVKGEAGVGKSRLLDELRTLALVEGMGVVHGQAISDVGLPYQIWRDVVRRLVLLSTVTDEQASVLIEIAPDIGHLLNREIIPAPQLSETAQKERLIDVIGQLIMGQNTPILLIMEDLHWSIDSLEPIAQVGDKLEGLPLCIVGSYRTDEQPNIIEKLPSAKQLTLNRLSHDEIVALSVSMIGAAANQPGVIDLIERETEGNTFFIVEVMRALAEEAGQLDNIGRITLPTSVVTGGMNAMIERRINRVPLQYQALLAVAAVIGRQIDLKIMQTVLSQSQTKDEFTLDEWLSVCESTNVMIVRDEKWQFSHDKLREHLLRQLGNLRELHRTAAQAIELVYLDDKARYHVLAEHWLAAGDIVKAIDYGVPAAKLMKDVSNYHEAIDLLYSIYTLWNPDLINETLQCDFFNQLGILHERVGEFDIANDFFARSYTIVQRLDDPIRLTDVFYGKGLVAYDLGEFEQALSHLESAFEIGRDVAEPKTIAQVLKVISNIYSKQDNFTVSNEYLQRALIINQEHDIKIEIAGCLNNLGVNAFLIGDHEMAHRYYQQALDVYTEVGYRSGVALSLGNIGDVVYADGAEVQIEYYKRALAINRDTGNQWGIALCLENLGMTYFLINHPNIAMQMFEESLQILRKIGDRFGTQHMLMELGFIYTLQKDYDQARDYLEQSLNLGRDLELGLNLALCIAYYAYLDMTTGALDFAAEKLFEAFQQITKAELSSVAYDVLSIYAHLFKYQEKLKLSLLCCLYLSEQEIMNDGMQQFILDPLSDDLKPLFSTEDYQHLHLQAQALNIDDLIKLISDNQNTDQDYEPSNSGI